MVILLNLPYYFLFYSRHFTPQEIQIHHEIFHCILLIPLLDLYFHFLDSLLEIYCPQVFYMKHTSLTAFLMIILIPLLHLHTHFPDHFLEIYLDQVFCIKHTSSPAFLMILFKHLTWLRIHLLALIRFLSSLQYFWCYQNHPLHQSHHIPPHHL